MRMRKRSNLEARMERCADLLIEQPAALRGQWLRAFPDREVLYVELGCGKGRFTADMAEALPRTLLVAVERVPDAMILAMERVRERGLGNVRFLDIDAQKLPELFAPGEVSRIYINFCDPWPKSRDAKLRLTAPGFLRLYADALPVGGQIHFKTDNVPLFDWSVGQLEAEGWSLSELTHDLHANGPVGVMTDYEAKFTASGMKINRLVATRTAATLGTAAGPVPRLRGASLVDARGYAESMAHQPKEDA
ncbi:MAG: tRNA (guanosine(46)-N7)-methyltransferase TrmB [Oscillospiraceae bacterium]|nr:tRNA (guanosine(46)-N7)-methyltransferase TrmB [Oscillospiraceae bacterium]